MFLDYSRCTTQYDIYLREKLLEMDLRRDHLSSSLNHLDEISRNDEAQKVETKMMMMMMMQKQLWVKMKTMTTTATKDTE